MHRRLLTFLLAFALVATPLVARPPVAHAVAAVDDFGSNIETANVSSITVTLPGGTPTDDDMLVIGVGSVASGATFTYPSGFVEYDVVGGRGTCAMASKVAASETGNTYTVNVDTSQEMVIGMWVLSGVDPSTSTPDLVATGGPVSADTVTMDTSPSVTSQADTFAVAVACSYSEGGNFTDSWTASGSATVGTPTNRGDENSGSGTDVTASFGDVDVTSTGTVSMTSKTKVGSLTNRLAGSMLIFLDAAAAPGGAPERSRPWYVVFSGIPQEQTLWTRRRKRRQLTARQPLLPGGSVR